MSAAGKSVNSLPRGNPQVGLSSLQFHPWSSETFKKMHLYSVDIKLAQGLNFEKKSYLGEGKKFCLCHWERQPFDLVTGFSYWSRRIFICIANVMQFWIPFHVIFPRVHTFWTDLEEYALESWKAHAPCTRFQLLRNLFWPHIFGQKAPQCSLLKTHALWKWKC